MSHCGGGELGQDDAPPNQTMKAPDARQHWGKLLRAVSRKKARIIVEKHGLPVAAVVSMDDLARLQGLEAQQPAGDAAAADADSARFFEERRRRNQRVPLDLNALFAPPTPEQTVRREAVLAQIEQHLSRRVITPLTAADLIHAARAGSAAVASSAREEESYGSGR